MNKDIRSEIDARDGSPQVLIKQVILYHEIQCNYDESRLKEDCATGQADEPKSTDTRLVLFGKNSTSFQPYDIGYFKKSKSKSQMSLSSLEINVVSFLPFYFFTTLLRSHSSLVLQL